MRINLSYCNVKLVIVHYFYPRYTTNTHYLNRKIILEIYVIMALIHNTFKENNSFNPLFLYKYIQMSW